MRHLLAGKRDLGPLDADSEMLDCLRVMACLRCPAGSNPCAIPMRTHTISFGERICVVAGWRFNRSISAGREGRGKEAEAADRQLSKAPLPQPQH